jgi:DNA-binding NarL/FixJ family response regulator
MTIAVALVDDHPVVTAGLETALRDIPDLDVVARGATAAEARQLLARDDIDVVLLDIRLPDGNGMQVLAETVTEQRPAVLILSSFMTAQYVAAAVRFGAQGFLLKTAPLEELVAAIRHVAAGGSTFSAAELRQARAGLVTLTPREREVVRLVIEGRSNDEIAHQLGAARKTIEKHLLQLFERLGVASRTELAVRAEREGWLDFDGSR